MKRSFDDEKKQQTTMPWAESARLVKRCCVAGAGRGGIGQVDVKIG